MSNEIAIRQESPVQQYSFGEIERMGLAVAKSGLFGVKTPDQAVALLLLAQAEGLHPMAAARDYHIMDIKGVVRPSMKAETMLARFQANGGKVEWLDYSEKKVSGKFTHHSGGQLTVEWTIERAQKIGLTDKDIWKKYPAAMLRSRVISEAIRTINPGVLSGLYTPDEAEAITIIDAGHIADPIKPPTEKKAEKKSEKNIPATSPPGYGNDGGTSPPHKTATENMKSEWLGKNPPPSDPDCISEETAHVIGKMWSDKCEVLGKDRSVEVIRELKDHFRFARWSEVREADKLDLIDAIQKTK
ncbi:MAG: hypothetical protein ACYDBI_05945 [Thermoplasmataceae archaeon]